MFGGSQCQISRMLMHTEQFGWITVTEVGGRVWKIRSRMYFLAPRRREVIFFLHNLKGADLFYASLANIFNKCHKKTAFMKYNLIWLYKYEHEWWGGGSIILCTRGVDYYLCTWSRVVTSFRVGNQIFPPRISIKGSSLREEQMKLYSG